MTIYVYIIYIFIIYFYIYTFFFDIAYIFLIFIFKFIRTELTHHDVNMFGIVALYKSFVHTAIPITFYLIMRMCMLKTRFLKSAWKMYTTVYNETILYEKCIQRNQLELHFRTHYGYVCIFVRAGAFESTRGQQEQTRKESGFGRSEFRVKLPQFLKCYEFN